MREEQEESICLLEEEYDDSFTTDRMHVRTVCTMQ